MQLVYIPRVDEALNGNDELKEAVREINSHAEVKNKLCIRFY